MIVVISSYTCINEKYVVIGYLVPGVSCAVSNTLNKVQYVRDVLLEYVLPGFKFMEHGFPIG